METETTARVNKREFISRVANRSALPLRTVGRVYDSLLGELTDSVLAGESVVLTGFGKFYLQNHKGHRVRFGAEGVEDYRVLKFSASPGLNKRLGSRVGIDGMIDGITEQERLFAAS